MIHYSEFVARRASPLPLLAAIGSLAAIAIWLGDPQGGVGAALPGRVPVAHGAAVSAPAPVAPRQSGVGVPVALALFNRDRAAAGLAALRESPQLDAIASTRAQQMVTDGLTHIRPGGTAMAATELLHQNGMAYTWSGENIFWSGGPPFDEALSDADAWWMSSPEHRDNILGPHFRQVGVGTAIDGGKLYIAAVFTD